MEIPPDSFEVFPAEDFEKLKQRQQDIISQLSQQEELKKPLLIAY